MIAVSKVAEINKAVINITPMINEEFGQRPVKTNFNSETKVERLGRREKNWTGQVVFKQKPIESKK